MNKGLVFCILFKIDWHSSNKSANLRYCSGTGAQQGVTAFSDAVQLIQNSHLKSGGGQTPTEPGDFHA